jgi:hypothetical protein
MVNMKVLVSSTEFRAGKTSFIIATSAILNLTFSYLKPSGFSENESKLIQSDVEGQLTLIEGDRTYKTGLSRNTGDPLIDADKTILIARYSEEVFDEIVLASKVLKNLKTAIINEIPESRLDEVKERAEKLECDVAGFIPYDKFLGGLNTRAIKECLRGVFLANPDENFVIEELLIGAMSPDCAVKWLRNARNAALITGGDRVDLQKLALDTGIKCLILTGNIEPPKIIVRKANESGVNIILAEFDTLTAVEMIEEMGRGEVDERKRDRVVEVFKNNMDLKKLSEVLDLS